MFLFVVCLHFVFVVGGFIFVYIPFLFITFAFYNTFFHPGSLFHVFLLMFYFWSYGTSLKTRVKKLGKFGRFKFVGSRYFFFIKMKFLLYKWSAIRTQTPVIGINKCFPMLNEQETFRKDCPPLLIIDYIPLWARGGHGAY